MRFYKDLASRGEATVERLQTQPQVKRALEQADVARQRADEVLGRVTFRIRSTGEKAAQTTERVSDEAAQEVSGAGHEAASATRSAAQKAAHRTSQARRSTTGTDGN
jgi:heparin binding hemagglutinin HbhA